MKYKYHLLSGIFVLCLVISLTISLTPTPIICDPSKGCDVVLNSAYSSTYGIKNAYFGVVAFSILLIFSFSQLKNYHKRKKHVIHSGIIIGSVIALYLIYLQVSVLKAYCKYCLVVDLSILIALGIIILYWEK